MSGYGPDEARRAPAERPRGSRAARRFFAFLAVVVLFVAAVAVAVTIAASTSNNVVHFRKVVAHDTNDAVKQLQRSSASTRNSRLRCRPPRVTRAGMLGSLGHSPGRE